MPSRKKRARRPEKVAEDRLSELDLYLEWWMSLTPDERLRRSWRMRSRLKDLQAIHDERSLPEL